MSVPEPGSPRHLFGDGINGSTLDDRPTPPVDRRRHLLAGAIAMWTSDHAGQIADYLLTRFPDLDLGVPDRAEEVPCTCPPQWWDVLRSFGGPGGVHLVACPVHRART